MRALDVGKLAKSCQEELDRIADAFRRGIVDHRQAVLECGRLCHELCVTRLADGFQTFGTRAMISDHLKQVCGRRVDVGKMVCCHWIVSLLGDGDAGRLSLEALFMFYPFMHRDWRHDQFRIKEGFESRARQLFGKARDEGWIREKVRQLVTKQMPGEAFRHRAGPGRPKDNGIPDKFRRGNGVEVENPLLLTKEATPRDLAEMIAEMIRSHPEPETVARWILMEKGMAALFGTSKKKVG